MITRTPRCLPSTARLFCTSAQAEAAARRSPNTTTGHIRKSAKVLSPHLPQTELFHELHNMGAITSRPTLINEDSARDLVRAWGVDKMHDVVVLEPYAGELGPACAETPADNKC